jgi:hypothetical protein
MKFKVGDRVVVKQIDEDFAYLIGMEAIVVDVCPTYEYPVELEFVDATDSDDFPELFKEAELELVENKVALKEEFVAKMKEVGVPVIISVAVQLPSGAIEVITNTQDTVTKALYYTDMYDEEFRLKVNPKVRVIGFMVV